MKLHLDPRDHRNLFSASGPGFIELNKTARHEKSLIVLPERLIEGWAPKGFGGLTADDFAALAALDAGIVLIGTGARQQFPAPALLRPLMEARVGYEIMDTAAACRTYNILVGEGRLAAAALIIE